MSDHTVEKRYGACSHSQLVELAISFGRVTYVDDEHVAHGLGVVVLSDTTSSGNVVFD
jgi:hypothetical protein